LSAYKIFIQSFYAFNILAISAINPIAWNGKFIYKARLWRNPLETNGFLGEWNYYFYWFYKRTEHWGHNYVFISSYYENVNVIRLLFIYFVWSLYPL